jgi:tRNA(fMet)-specific endonuclease VapC
MRYLLDTNICIALIRQRSPEILGRITKHQITDIAISAVTIAELQYGVNKSSQIQRNQQALDQFLIPFTFLDFDYAAAQAYGPIRAALEAQGIPIGPLDTLIAAQAVAHSLVLATNNTKEFSRIPHLVLEDWTKPETRA